MAVPLALSYIGCLLSYFKLSGLGVELRGELCMLSRNGKDGMSTKRNGKEVGFLSGKTERKAAGSSIHAYHHHQGLYFANLNSGITN